MRTIKNKTYNNFMYVLRRIQDKGYSHDEAYTITQNLFAEFNPNGLSMSTMIDRVLDLKQYNLQY